MAVLDTFGASETGGQGRLRRADGVAPPRLVTDEHTAVLGDDLSPVGPGEVGRLARTGWIPLGYHGDPERSAATFPVIDGQRWSVPGDLARLEPDGTITLLGRGSTSINTGGEKVFPEEVENVLRGHPSVLDALVVGVPDERFGEGVAAVVAARPGALGEADTRPRPTPGAFEEAARKPTWRPTSRRTPGPTSPATRCPAGGCGSSGASAWPRASPTTPGRGPWRRRDRARGRVRSGGGDG